MNKEKVSVVGIDENKIKQHSTNPEYIELPFVLSCAPDETWRGICVSMYGNTKPATNRRMFILDNTIIIVAHIDDDLKGHKKIIEEVVSRTNEKYSELLQKTKEERARAKKELEENQAKLAEFRKRAKNLY